MSDEELKEFIDEMKQTTLDLDNNPQLAIDLLESAGLIDEKGNVTEPYRSS